MHYSSFPTIKDQRGKHAHRGATLMPSGVTFDMTRFSLQTLAPRASLLLIITLVGCGDGYTRQVSPTASGAPEPTSPELPPSADDTPAPGADVEEPGHDPELGGELPLIPSEPGGASNAGEQPDEGGPDGAGETPPPRASGCEGSILGAGDHALTLEHDGQTREYLVHVPAGYEGTEPVPLVVDLHGLTSSATAQAALSGWRRKADAEGFIVVHPQGLGNSWNGGALCCGSSQRNDVDDEGFVRALVDAMKRDACIDAQRVYATGLSNGGALSHLLACNAADVFAATAPVSMGNGTRPCEPSRPISVVMVRGTRDPLVAFDGGLFPSAREDFEQWGRVNGCQSEASTASELCTTFAECDGGVEVTLCALDAGHVLYQNAQGFSVPDFVWQAFERQHLP